MTSTEKPVGPETTLPDAPIGPDVSELKPSLIQHISIPNDGTGAETDATEIADGVQADLFSWDPLEGIESELTRKNIKAFNDIRMKGELFAPTMPFVDSLGSINPIPHIEGLPAVKESIGDMWDEALEASKLNKTAQFKSTSEIIPSVDPFGFPGRRQTPFIPNNQLAPGFHRDVDMNGMPIEWNREDIMHRHSNEMRMPLYPDPVPPHPYWTAKYQLEQVNTKGFNYIY